MKPYKDRDHSAAKAARKKRMELIPKGVPTNIGDPTKGKKKGGEK